MTEQIVAAVDLVRLAHWMDDHGLECGPIRDAVQLPGGTQNILLKFGRGGRQFVLRRPPPVPRAGNDETMRREARVLDALKGTQVPHPGLIAVCSDTRVLGAAFYLMEPVNGFNAAVGLPAPHNADRAMRRAMGFALVDGAATLARLDHAAVGLADFGRPDGYLERQVQRWRTQLDGYRSQPGYPGAGGLPGVADVSEYLDAYRPNKFRAGILHGDYQIGNVLYRYDGPELAAIIDWELATIGDPLMDLGWIVATWRGAGGPDLPVLVIEPFDGFPDADELIARYADQSDRDLSAVDWYVVLACFKLATILEGTYARARAGLAPMQTGLSLHDTAIKLMQRALHRIGG
jgi:aminoglycoside phosphotransferase (APT) family kinase protein